MRLLKYAFALATFAAVSNAALADSVRDRQERACQADAMKFCKDFVPDENKIAACMGKHRSELSVNCGIMYDAGTRGQ